MRWVWVWGWLTVTPYDLTVTPMTSQWVYSPMFTVLSSLLLSFSREAGVLLSSPGVSEHGHWSSCPSTGDKPGGSHSSPRLNLAADGGSITRMLPSSPCSPVAIALSSVFCSQFRLSNELLAGSAPLPPAAAARICNQAKVIDKGEGHDCIISVYVNV